MNRALLPGDNGGPHIGAPASGSAQVCVTPAVVFSHSSPMARGAMGWSRARARSPAGTALACLVWVSPSLLRLHEHHELRVPAQRDTLKTHFVALPNREAS